MAADARHNRPVDEFHRITTARVFGYGSVVVVGNAVFVENHVFQNRAESYSVPDLRLVLLRKLDALRIAPALEVEHARIAPAMLVVADQPPLRIRAQGCFAGSAKSEKERGVSSRADIGGAVHAKNAFQR